jgi:hypothetical protein
MVALAWGDELSRLDDPEGLDDPEWLEDPDVPGDLERLDYLDRLHERREWGVRRPARPQKFFWRRLVVLCVLSVLGVVAWGATEEVFGAPGASPAGLQACLSPAAVSHSVDLAAASSGAPGGTSSAGATGRQLNLTGDGAGACPQTYVARPGDTIWAIAVRFSGGGDPRPLAAELEAEIGGAALQPGQVLAVPADVPLHR